MTTKLITNSYQVQYIFDYATISTCVFASDEEEAVVVGADVLCYDLGVRADLLSETQDIIVELLDEDVL